MQRFSPRSIIRAIFVCAVLFAYVITSTPSPQVGAATNGRIVYVSPDTSSDLQIHSVNIDGSDDKQLTNDPYIHIFPRYSPDGSQIVFASTPSPDGSIQLIVMSADGTSQINITNDSNSISYQPAWSPDGSKIVFARIAADYSGSFALYTIQPDGTNLTAVTDGNSNAFAPAWNHDGSKIAYNCDNGHICSMDADGSNSTQITSGADTHGAPAFSPDGTQIAYVNTATGYVQTLIIMNADGSNTHTVNTGGTTNDGVSWSPDGTKLLYNRLDTLQSVDRVYYINLDGTGETVVSPDNQSGYFASWQPIPAADADGDSIPSVIEAAAPNNGDGNGDGITDKDQPTVTSFLNPVTNTYTTLQSTCSANGAVSATAVPSLFKDAAFTYPTGLLNFSLACNNPGATATVTQYFHGLTSSPIMVLRKYSNTSHSYATITGTTINTITLSGKALTKASYPITDGGSLDQDGAKNGVIIDPVGIASPSVGAPNTGFGGSILSWLSAAPSL